MSNTTPRVAERRQHWHRNARAAAKAAARSPARFPSAVHRLAQTLASMPPGTRTELDMDFETRAAADRVKRLWGEFKLCLRNEVNARHALAPVGGLHARIGVREAEGAGPEAPPTFRLTIHRLTSAGEVFTPSICEALETALGMEKGEILSSSP